MSAALTTSPALVDRTFGALGSEVRVVVVGDRATELARGAEREVTEYDARLSRFRPDSELWALNADQRATVPASPRLREAVSAGLWAAEHSGGLVDPCLLDALERAGYTRSLAPSGGRPAPGVPAPSGPARPARPSPSASWRDIQVDDRAGTITRPPGLRIDLGGSGKGHVADRVAALMAGAERWAIDCGGDVRVGGEGGAQQVLVAHPLGGWAGAFDVADGAVATSSVLARAWVGRDGRRAHHVLDPATGRPAWTGLLAATAVGRTGVEAETLAKTALLSGRRGARRVLAAHGGLVVDGAGRVERVG